MAAVGYGVVLVVLVVVVGGCLSPLPEDPWVFSLQTGVFGIFIGSVSLQKLVVKQWSWIICMSGTGSVAEALAGQGTWSTLLPRTPQSFQPEDECTHNFLQLDLHPFWDQSLAVKLGYLHEASGTYRDVGGICAFPHSEKTSVFNPQNGVPGIFLGLMSSEKSHEALKLGCFHDGGTYPHL